MSAAVSGCCKRMLNILMPYLNWHGLLYWEFLLSQWEPGDFWGTLLSNLAEDCPVKGALSKSFASSTENFFPCCSYLENPCAYFSFKTKYLNCQSRETNFLYSSFPSNQSEAKQYCNCLSGMFPGYNQHWDQLIPVYWKNKQKPKRLSLSHLNISKLLTSPPHMQLYIYTYHTLLVMKSLVISCQSD